MKLGLETLLCVHCVISDAPIGGFIKAVCIRASHICSTTMRQCSLRASCVSGVSHCVLLFFIVIAIPQYTSSHVELLWPFMH